MFKLRTGFQDHRNFESLFYRLSFSRLTIKIVLAKLILFISLMHNCYRVQINRYKEQNFTIFVKKSSLLTLLVIKLSTVINRLKLY